MAPHLPSASYSTCIEGVANSTKPRPRTAELAMAHLIQAAPGFRRSRRPRRLTTRPCAVTASAVAPPQGPHSSRSGVTRQRPTKDRPLPIGPEIRRLPLPGKRPPRPQLPVNGERQDVHRPYHVPMGCSAGLEPISNEQASDDRRVRVSPGGPGRRRHDVGKSRCRRLRVLRNRERSLPRRSSAGVLLI